VRARLSATSDPKIHFPDLAQCPRCEVTESWCNCNVSCKVQLQAWNCVRVLGTTNLADSCCTVTYRPGEISSLELVTWKGEIPWASFFVACVHRDVVRLVHHEPRH
jgi:hypothetical protein